MIAYFSKVRFGIHYGFISIIFTIFRLRFSYKRASELVR